RPAVRRPRRRRRPGRQCPARLRPVGSGAVRPAQVLPSALVARWDEDRLLVGREDHRRRHRHRQAEHPCRRPRRGNRRACLVSRRLLLVDVRTRSVHRWPAQKHQAVAVAWSRDGSIAYTDGLDESDIWIVGTRSTWKTCVCDFYDPNYGDVTGLATDLAWSPDGSK